MRKSLYVYAAAWALTITLLCGGTFAGEATPTITLEQAAAKALEGISGGKLVYSGVDSDDGVTVFEIIIIDAADRHEFEIDPQTGNTLQYEKRAIVKTRTPLTAERAAHMDRAKTRALEASLGGDIIELEEDMEDGRLVFNIDIINQNYLHELEIDAESATILEHETERLP